MKTEIMDRVIGALKAHAMAFGANPEDIWRTSIMLVQWLKKGIDPAEPFALGSILMLVRPMLPELPNPELAKAMMSAVPFANEDSVRRELEDLSDEEGISFVCDLQDLARFGPATVKRRLKGASESFEGLEGQLPVLTTNQCRKACKMILELQKQGEDIGEAKDKCVSEFKVSLSSINRCWERRSELTKAGLL